MLGPVERGLIGLLLLVLMLGMGAALSVAQFRIVAQRPRALLIGLASQFGWMPLIAFAAAGWLALPPRVALGLVLVGCTPGGTTSNMYTYFARGELALSVAMTSVSSVSAVFMMPLLLWAYASHLTRADLQVPYGAIVQTLVLSLVPVAIGMWIRLRNPRAAARLERLGSLAGGLVIALLTVSMIWRNTRALGALGGREWLAAFALGALGLGLGYLAARSARLNEPERRAVCFETGVQNTALALAIMVASFPPAEAAAMVRIAIAYALSTTVFAALVALGFRRCGSGHAVTASLAASSR